MTEDLSDSPITGPRDARLRHDTADLGYDLLDDPQGTPPERLDPRLELLYGEVCAQWRDLHDTRFKLLALLPIATVAALLVAPKSPDGVVEGMAAVLVFALGLAVTHGLRLYDRRNDTLYDDLISRGRRIEHDLGIRTGVFRGRLDSVPGSGISHGKAVGIVYTAMTLAWAVGLAGALTLLALQIGGAGADAGS